MDIKKIREDFMILNRADAPIYFDNACSTLRPKQVIDAMDEYYNEYPACAGRSGHKLGNEATERIDLSRKLIGQFINTKYKDEIVFTRNTTEGINLVAHGLDWKEGDGVLTTDKEHNSNLLPWIRLAQEKKIEHKICPTNCDGTFNLENYEKILKQNKIKLIAVNWVSNLDGVENPAEQIIKIAHKNGAMVLLDAAQAVPHIKVNVQDLDCDFLAFSGHKMLGPSGTGVLYVKKENYKKLSPFMLGGGTVSKSTYGNFDLLPPPECFEAGLQNYAGIIGLAEACQYIKNRNVELGSHDRLLTKINVQSLNRYISAFLREEFPQIKIIGPEDATLRSNIISFYTDKLPSHQIMILLDKAGIAVRSGQFCVHSWFNANKIKDAVRASVYFYNTEEEAEKFVEEMKKISKIF